MTTRPSADVGRMLALVPWLIERPGASLTEAAEAFGVTVAEIQQDLSHLNFCGLPGLGGGDLLEVDIVGDRVVLSMADELRRPLRPTAVEALRLVMTVDAVADVLGEHAPALRSGLAKIRHALGIGADVADVVTDHSSHLSLILTAIDRQVQVDLRYQGRADSEPRSRRVDPWALRMFEGQFYLQAWDHDADGARTFRLDRIADAVVDDTPIATVAPLALDEPVYEPGQDDVVVELDVTPAGRWVLDGLQVDTLSLNDDGSAHVTFRTDALEFVCRLVVAAGGAARVGAPPALVQMVIQRAQSALDVAELYN